MSGRYIVLLVMALAGCYKPSDARSPFAADDRPQIQRIISSPVDAHGVVCYSYEWPSTTLLSCVKVRP